MNIKYPNSTEPAEVRKYNPSDIDGIVTIIYILFRLIAVSLLSKNLVVEHNKYPCGKLQCL